MTVSILKGDCRQVMFVLGENVVDSIVTDPPYELTSARPGGRSEATRDWPKALRHLPGYR